MKKTIGLTIIAASSLVFLSACGDKSVSESEMSEVADRLAPVGSVAVAPEAAPAAPAAEATPAAPAAEMAPAAEAPAAAPMAEAPAAAPAAEAPAAAPAAAAPAADGAALAQSSGCMGCHQIEVKVLGPAYKEVAAKYKADANAVDMLSAKVKSGGVGTWGQVPMPPNAHVSDENIKAIVSWIMSL